MARAYHDPDSLNTLVSEFSALTDPTGQAKKMGFVTEPWEEFERA